MLLFKPNRLPFHLFHAGHTWLAIQLQRLLVFANPKQERCRSLAFFQDGAALRRNRWEGTKDYPVYVMNRKRDTERLGRFARTCQRWGITFERVEGIDLQVEPDLLKRFDENIAGLCYNQKNFVRGIYGCFLAHREAWLRFRDSGADWALICEDDARFLGPIPKRITDYCIPPETDIVFANQRMAAGVLQRARTNTQRVFDFVPVGTALAALLQLDEHLVAPGGDGYLLSKMGVEKLLRAFDESQMAFDVDWFLLFQTLNPAEMQYFLSTDRTGRFTGHCPHPARLKARVVLPSLVEQAEGESKVRRAEFCSRSEMLG
jgi:GR25 family glycosyltransferase involved in LPS biosynthesis